MSVLLPCVVFLICFGAAFIVDGLGRRRYPHGVHAARHSWDIVVERLCLALIVTAILSLCVLTGSKSIARELSVVLAMIGFLTLVTAISGALSQRSRHQLIHRHCVCRECHYIRDPQPEGPCPECGSDCGTVGPVKE